MQQNDATEAIRAQQRALAAALPFDDTRDHDATGRGFIAAFEPGTVQSSSRTSSSAAAVRS